jgi:hypothetical protein
MYFLVEDHPSLLLTISVGGHTRPALVIEPKADLLAQGIVILIDRDDGLFWHDNLAVTLPADPSNAREETVLHGATTDPAIVAAVRQWVAATDADDYQPGPAPIE